MLVSRNIPELPTENQLKRYITLQIKCPYFFWLIATIHPRFKLFGKSLQSKILPKIYVALLSTMPLITNRWQPNLCHLQQMYVISQTWIFSNICPIEEVMEPKITLFYKQSALNFWPITMKRTQFVVNMCSVLEVNLQEFAMGGEILPIQSLLLK